MDTSPASALPGDGSRERTDLEAPSGPSRGTVTLLFSDIEASTRLLHAVGDDYGQVLQTHRRLLRGAFEAHGGYEVDTAGDGFFVAFHKARDAVQAAMAGQHALAKEPWGDGISVRVRMGVHTGEPTETEGSYVGLDVHRAARICSAAHGGQVLVSGVTRHLLGPDLPTGCDLQDLGTHRLKDIPQPEQLHQLLIAGLPQEFPPVRAEAGRVDNLPSSTDRLIGRDNEITAVKRLLLEPATRIVTLTGPGGSGKTRLALAVGAELGASYQDGVCFTPIASIADPALVPGTVASHLGLRENPGLPPLDALAKGVGARRILLVLDNFEHVMAAASGIGALIRRCPNLTVLVTSRIVLRLAGEREFAVPPLPLPTVGKGGFLTGPTSGARTVGGLPVGLEATTPSEAPLGAGELERLRAHGAVALFVERAREVRADFSLSAENALTVCEICRRVDGLPLALELAAARIKLLSPGELLDRLQRRLDLLSGGSRDGPDRHRALRQTIALSHELMAPEEQIFFRRMAVFMGGATLDAVESVCADPDATQVPDPASSMGVLGALEAVATLVDQSLLLRVEGSDGRSRFAMLETIREFGLECLAAAGEEARVRRAHAEFYLSAAERAEPHLTGPDQVAWMDRLEAEHDNLRAALSWAGSNDAALAVRMAAALWRFWVARGHMREGRDWLERVLRLPGEANQIRARALNAAGTISHEMGLVGTARDFLTESLGIARSLEDKRGVALVLNNLGWMAVMISELAASREYSGEALVLHRELGDPRGMAVALNNLAWAAMTQGDWEQATHLFEESLRHRREAQDPRGAAFAMSYLGAAKAMLGQYDEARALLDEAIAAHEDMNNRQGLGNGFRALGVLQYELGDYEGAEAYAREGAELFRETGTRPGVALAREVQGRALVGLGRYGDARKVLLEAQAICQEVELGWLLAEVRFSLGRAAFLSGSLQEARELLEAVWAFRTEMGGQGSIEECRRLLDAVADATSETGED